MTKSGAAAAAPDSADFSLVRAGPIYRLSRTFRLDRSGRHEVSGRWLPLLAVGWLPYIGLGLLSGASPGLFLSMHTRYLFALPILLAAEAVVDGRVRECVRQLVHDGMIRGDGLPTFKAHLAQVAALRDSRVAAGVIIALSLGASWLATAAHQPLATVPISWYGSYISLPLFRVMLLSWGWRWLLWVVLLGGISRLRLRLVPTHPDQAGGLGILQQPCLGFGLVPLALAVVVSGEWVEKIARNADRLTAFVQLVGGFGIIVSLWIIGPTVPFMGALLRARTQGLREFGAFVYRHNQLFQDKWLGDTSADPLGDQSISTLTDAGSGYGYVRGMHLLPFDRTALALVAVLAASPALPLILTEIPISEIVEKIVGAVL